MTIMNEIVGAKIGSTITNIPEEIKKAVNENKVTRFLTRAEMRFMSAADLGRNWDLMANGPTLFMMDGKGNPYSTEETVFKSPKTKGVI